MRLLKFGLRFWLTLTSMISFLAGWILLAHSPKPVAASSSNTSAVPTLAPLQPLNSFQSGDDDFQNQSSFNNQPQFRQRPMFRSGGS